MLFFWEINHWDVGNQWWFLFFAPLSRKEKHACTISLVFQNLPIPREEAFGPSKAFSGGVFGVQTPTYKVFGRLGYTIHPVYLQLCLESFILWLVILKKTHIFQTPRCFFFSLIDVDLLERTMMIIFVLNSRTLTSSMLKASNQQPKLISMTMLLWDNGNNQPTTKF